MTIILSAVLSTKQCYDYVGGARIWEELINAHGDLLKPFRTVPRGDASWHRETVDNVLRVAQAKGTLLAAEVHLPVKVKIGRRFQTTAIS